MHVTPANAAGGDADQYLVLRGLGRREVCELELSIFGEQQGFHREAFTCQSVGVTIPLPSRIVKNLVRFYFLKPFNLLRGWPFDLDHVDGWRFAQAEVYPKIALRHDAGSAADFVHLRMIADDRADACADRGAVAFRSNQFQLDPVLPVTSIVAQE